MVTSLFRLQELPVRFRAPHPYILFALLAVCFLSSSASAADVDYYDEPPQVQSLAQRAVTPQTLFGVGFYYDTSSGKITQIGGKSFVGRADGVQDLATEVYDLALGIDSSFSTLSGQSSDILNVLNLIYELLYNEDSYHSLYALLSQLLDNSESLLKSFHSSKEFWIAGQAVYGDYNLGTILAIMTKNQTYGPYLFGQQILSRDGSLSSTYSAISASRMQASGLMGLAAILGGSPDGSFSYLDVTGVVQDSNRVNVSIARVIGEGFSGLAELLFGPYDYAITYLKSDGTDGGGGRGSLSLLDATGSGFSGLATLIAGTDGNRTASIHWVDPSDPFSSMETEDSNLFDLVARGFSVLQNPLARLQYVFASDSDIGLKDAVQDITDSFEDNFTGDGAAAASPSDIKDAADLSSGLSGGFSGGGVSSGDVFTAIGSGESYGFFSQEVADSFDTVGGVPSGQNDSDDFMDMFVADEDGFYSLADLSPWSIDSFLGR